MKRTGLLRTVCMISFLLLLAPFYDQCGSHRMKKRSAGATLVQDTTVVETDAAAAADGVTKAKIITEDAYEVPFYEKAYDLIDSDDDENAFELASVCEVYLENGIFSEMRKEIREEQKKGDDGRPCNVIAHPIKFFCFALIIIITIVMMVISFTKKSALLHKLAFTNLILSGIILICIFFFDEYFEKFSQIKWGFYMFIISQLILYRLTPEARPL